MLAQPLLLLAPQLLPCPLCAPGPSCVPSLSVAPSAQWALPLDNGDIAAGLCAQLGQPDCPTQRQPHVPTPGSSEPDDVGREALVGVNCVRFWLVRQLRGTECFGSMIKGVQDLRSPMHTDLETTWPRRCL